jgi:tRNA/tmRNA/rRNA uracil-C5-methylase (TrmA/RlmC/RlmD family)
MEVGSQIKIEIEKCVFGGDGLGRVDGQVVFVPGALPGEILIAEVTKIGRDFLRAKPVRWGTVSPHRIETAPNAAERYPECCYLHTTFEYETELKNRQLADFIAQTGVADPAAVMGAPIAPEPAVGYRNKLMLHVNKENGKAQIGYVGADKQSVTTVEQCPLAHPAINAELARFLADPASGHSVHNHMTLTFRYTEPDGVKFWRNQPPRNASWLRESTSIGLISVPMDGFFQVNIGGADALIAEFGGLLDQLKPQRVIDLYCGVGLFAAVAAAKGVPEIAGAELAEELVAAAKFNLARRERPDAEIVAADAAAALPALLEKSSASTLLVVDPPRQGLGLKLVHTLAALPSGDLVYVSCHPATWARDVGRLAKAGWNLRTVRQINQFGRTLHFEMFSYFHKGD